jgi:hypothetical protein
MVNQKLDKTLGSREFEYGNHTISVLLKMKYERVNHTNPDGLLLNKPTGSGVVRSGIFELQL